MVKLSKRTKRMLGVINKYAIRGVVGLLGLFAMAMLLQHILTFLLLAIVLASMGYLLWRFEYASQYRIKCNNGAMDSY